MNEFNETVVKFNRYKSFLIEWKHQQECLDGNGAVPEPIRNQIKKEYNDILKEYPDINDIMPEFYCSTCKNLTN